MQEKNFRNRHVAKLAGKISIIVPFFNSSTFLGNCLQSILNQTYKDLEILLVDDGSTDDSYRIASNFALRDPRIKLFQKENSGVSSSLNFGLAKATGDYIGFVDSDDTIQKDFYQSRLEDLLRHHVDIACGNMPANHSFVCGIDGDFWNLFFVNPLMTIARFNKLYKKEVFSYYSFPEGRVSEDLSMFIGLSKTNLLLYISPDDRYAYNYKNDQSLTHNHSLSDWGDIVDSWVACSCLFRRVYGFNDKSYFPIGNAIDYYFAAKKGFPKNPLLKALKKRIADHLFFRGLRPRVILHIVKFLVFG